MYGDIDTLLWGGDSRMNCDNNLAFCCDVRQVAFQVPK